MQWLKGRKPEAQQLSNQVKQSVMEQFNLDLQTVDQMRFSSKRGRYVDRPVKYIRIFDPLLIEKGESAAPSYDAVGPADGRRCALLFEGHIESIHGTDRVFLSDRRPA